MAKGIGFRARIAVRVVTCLAAASLVGTARAGDTARLSGHWNYNQNESDDAQQKVRDAQQDSRNNPDQDGGNYPGRGGQNPNGGGYPGGGVGRVGIPGIGGIWLPGTGGGGGRTGRQSGANRAGVSSEEWERLAQDPKYLKIDQTTKQIAVTDDNGNTQTYYPDGKKHDDKDSGGGKGSTQAEWESGTLTAETRLGHSERLTQTFRVSDDGKQLFVTTRFEAPTLNGPLSIRRVYDLGKGETD